MRMYCKIDRGWQVCTQLSVFIPLFGTEAMQDILLSIKGQQWNDRLIVEDANVKAVL